MRPRRYDQDAHGNRICPQCGGAYGHTYISKHVRICIGDPAPSQSSGGAILRRKAAKELASLLAAARKELAA
jgi:hypothetical protein